MARKTYEELNDIKQKYGVDTLWSWSRYHCYKQDHWEYYLKYVAHEKEDRNNSIYAVSGGNVHDILEEYYTDKIQYEDMIDKYEDSLFTMNCAELKYNRSDSEKNDLIADKYENCIRHFFKTHQTIPPQNFVEKFILIKIAEDIYMQGYADMIHVDKTDKSAALILDWKTSTRYQGKKIEQELGQLLLYSEGLHQMTGIPLENISAAWNFLKYATVTIEQKNGKKKDRHIERNKLGESLLNTAKMWLKHFDYEDQIEDFTDRMVLENDIECLPDEVKEKFEIKDCYIYIPITEEKIAELKQDIIDTVHEINKKTEEYNNAKDINIWWQEVTDADEFRLATLCGYSRKLHKPYDEYLKAKEMFMNKEEEENDSVEDDLMDFINNL